MSQQDILGMSQMGEEKESKQEKQLISLYHRGIVWSLKKSVWVIKWENVLRALGHPLIACYRQVIKRDPCGLRTINESLNELHASVFGEAQVTSMRQCMAWSAGLIIGVAWRPKEINAAGKKWIHRVCFQMKLKNVCISFGGAIPILPNGFQSFYKDL